MASFCKDVLISLDFLLIPFHLLGLVAVLQSGDTSTKFIPEGNDPDEGVITAAMNGGRQSTYDIHTGLAEVYFSKDDGVKQSALRQRSYK